MFLHVCKPVTRSHVDTCCSRIPLPAHPACGKESQELLNGRPVYFSAATDNIARKPLYFVDLDFDFSRFLFCFVWRSGLLQCFPI
jgi:hypothetical protein